MTFNIHSISIYTQFTFYFIMSLIYIYHSHYSREVVIRRRLKTSFVNFHSTTVHWVSNLSLFLSVLKRESFSTCSRLCHFSRNTESILSLERSSRLNSSFVFILVRTKRKSFTVQLRLKCLMRTLISLRFQQQATFFHGKPLSSWISNQRTGR